MLRCAREEIAKHGIYAASLNEVARRAGGSKATITKLFGNKAGLFAAVMAETLDEALRGFVLEVVGAPESLEAALERVGVSLLSFYLQPESLSVYRAVVGSGRSSRELTKTFYESGHLRVVNEVAGVLRHFEKSSLRAGLDVEAEAGRFTHLIRSGFYERALLGLASPRPTRRELQETARAAVRVFLYGVTAPGR